MDVTVTVTDHNLPHEHSIDWFSDWSIGEKPNCPYSPKYNLSTSDSDDEQTVKLDIYFGPDTFSV